MSANQKPLDEIMRSEARGEIIALLDILIRVFEKGELTNPIDILKGARNAVIKRGVQPELDQLAKNLDMAAQRGGQSGDEGQG